MPRDSIGEKLLTSKTLAIVASLISLGVGTTFKCVTWLYDVRAEVVDTVAGAEKKAAAAAAASKATQTQLEATEIKLRLEVSALQYELIREHVRAQNPRITGRALTDAINHALSRFEEVKKDPLATPASALSVVLAEQ